MFERARKRLTKKAKRGFRGWPVATVAFYGPDDRRASIRGLAQSVSVVARPVLDRPHRAHLWRIGCRGEHHIRFEPLKSRPVTDSNDSHTFQTDTQRSRATRWPWMIETSMSRGW